MDASPELIELIDRLDDLDPILDPAPDKFPTAGGLPITADELCLLGHSTMGEVIEAVKEASERAGWRVLAMGNAIEAHKAALGVLAPYWPGDMPLKDALEAAPADVRDQALAFFAEHDRWSAAVGGKWHMTAVDLEEGWLRGEFRRVKLNEQGECVCWRQITIIDPDVVAERAGYADEYRQVVERMKGILRSVSADNPGADADEMTTAALASYPDEITDVVVRLTVIGVLLDQIDEKHSVAVDDAGMPIGEEV